MSGCVALHLALPGVVVAWFVTGFRTRFELGLVDLRCAKNRSWPLISLFRLVKLLGGIR